MHFRTLIPHGDRPKKESRSYDRLPPDRVRSLNRIQRIIGNRAMGVLLAGKLDRQTKKMPGDGINNSEMMLQRANMKIKHRDGDEFEVPGVAENETEFGATGALSSLLTTTMKLNPDHPLTGGFSAPLAMDTGFGTGVSTTNMGLVGQLITKAGSRVDPKLQDALVKVAADQYIFNALKSYLEVDQGKFVAIVSGGHYDGKKPPTIKVGTDEGGLLLCQTIVHELMHYIFDRMDTVLGESKDSGGADHDAMKALETRYLIVALIREGKSPLHQKIENDFGAFLKSGDLFPQMTAAIRDNKPDDLSNIVTRSSFVNTVVQSGVMPTASSLKITPGPTDYRYTPNQFRDLAFLWAQNSMLIRHAMKTAAEIAKKRKLPLCSVFVTWEWKTTMSTFLSSFVTELNKDVTKGVVSLEGRL